MLKYTHNEIDNLLGELPKNIESFIMHKLLIFTLRFPHCSFV